mgnify:FL=1
MEKYIQKKLVISDEIHISGFLEKNKINSKFNLENLYNTQNNNFFVSQNIKEELIEKKSSSLKLILLSEIKNKDLKRLFKTSFDKIMNGGFLIFRTENINLHKIELAGMMMYYGFETRSEHFSNDKKYIIVQKTYEKSKIEKPALNFLIKLDRVGKDGKNLKIHKFRSMYRYSEFLHQGMLESSGLSSIGKVISDPRITPLGRFMRKYWIDELPQVIDLLTFKIKLIGIRAMSYAFFEKYPQRYKEKYFKVKPGLIGPIFDEKTAGFNEIVRIEEQYLDSYLESPYKTDFKLFFKTVFMIFKGSRSS